jgi:hypothetical protein
LKRHLQRDRQVIDTAAGRRGIEAPRDGLPNFKLPPLFRHVLDEIAHAHARYEVLLWSKRGQAASSACNGIRLIRACAPQATFRGRAAWKTKRKIRKFSPSKFLTMGNSDETSQVVSDRP